MNAEEMGAGNANSVASPGSRSTSELARMATQRLEDSWERGKVKFSEIQAALSEKTRECAEQTDAYVRANPWKALGWAAGIGFVIGLIVRRR